MKPIRLSGHAFRYISKRGFTAAEVEDAIRTSAWSPAELGVSTAEKISLTLANGMARGTQRNKCDRCSSDEPEEIVVVTVYTYYC